MKNQIAPIIAVVMAILCFLSIFIGINGIAKRDGIIDKQYEVIEMQTKAIETQKAVIDLYKKLTKTQKLIIEKQNKYKEAKLIVNNSRQEKYITIYCDKQEIILSIKITNEREVLSCGVKKQY